MNLDEWIEFQRERSTILKQIPTEVGSIETGHLLSRSRDAKWTLHELRKAVEAVKHSYSYSVSKEGITILESFGDSGQLPEYWYLRSDGACYSAGWFREDYSCPKFSRSSGHPPRCLWIDLSISRIALELRNSAEIYRLLDVSPIEPYQFLIRHNGLQGRALYAYDFKYLVALGSVIRTPLSRENSHEWQGEVSWGQVERHLVQLTHIIANSLFGNFESAKISSELVRKRLSSVGLN